jgi:tetratricopeptide (TPR) repeat protein
MTRSLSPRQPEFGEAVRLLADVYVQTGDALSLHRLLEQPWAQAAFGPERYSLLRALTASALADPQSESRFRRQLEERLQQSAAQSFLQGAIQLALGGDIGPAGSFFHGLFLQQQALTRSRERLLNLLAIASAHLEAGQLAQARSDFQRILELAPQEPIASLAAHYLRVLPEN